MIRFLRFYLLAMLMIVGIGTVTALDFEVNGIYYNINTDGKSVSVTCRGYSGQYPNTYTGEVTIPSTVTYSGKTYNVTHIGSAAFFGAQNLTAINLPSSIQSIESSAFRDCVGLTSVYIPYGVINIGSDAFSGCTKLSSIQIPNSVNAIGESAFYNSEFFKRL